MNTKLDETEYSRGANPEISNDNRPNLLLRRSRPGIPSLNIQNSRKSPDNFELKGREIGLDIEEGEEKNPEYPTKIDLNLPNLEMPAVDQQLSFPEGTRLSCLNQIFQDDPGFLTALVMTTDKSATLNKVRDSLINLSGSEELITFLKDRVKRIPSECALQILNSFLEAVDGSNAYDNEKENHEALPKFMSPFIGLLAMKAKNADLTAASVKLKQIIAALDKKCFVDSDNNGKIENNPGSISDIRKVKLGEKKGYFKTCFNLGGKTGNILPDQVEKGKFHFKNGLIAERNILSHELAKMLGISYICTSAQLACLEHDEILEVGLFTEEAPGNMVKDFFPEVSQKATLPDLGKLPVDQKMMLVRQLLCMEVFNYISGEQDPNCGNLNLLIENDKVQLTAFDRDFSFGVYGDLSTVLSNPFIEVLLQFSSEEAVSAVENFDFEKFGKLMSTEGFPESQVEAMKERVSALKEYIGKLRAEGKIYSNEYIKNALKVGLRNSGIDFPKVDSFRPTINWEIKILEKL